MSLPFHWRVTRYDPALRDGQGLYPLGDWSCLSDVGQVFNGRQLTYEDYAVSETAYTNAAVAFLTDAGVDALRLVYLDRCVEAVDATQGRDIRIAPDSLHAGSTVGKADLPDVVRLNLREIIWCKLAAKDRFYLHFGWDFYAYVGSISPSAEAIRQAEASGLYVEPMKSPHL